MSGVGFCGEKKNGTDLPQEINVPLPGEPNRPAPEAFI